jgi:uncharacterized protein YndB with AHSA1/START domain
MTSQTKSAVVHAPVDKVYEYLDDPRHGPQFWPSLIEVKDVHTMPNGGHSNRWTYKMAGVRLEGTSESIEHIKNQRLVAKTHGGVDSTQTWELEPAGDDTKVTFTVDYTVPVPARIGRGRDREAERPRGRRSDGEPGTPWPCGATEVPAGRHWPRRTREGPGLRGPWVAGRVARR